ncbi:DNA-binding response regulator [Tepiditoga spiralis]|uniref:DNA-binding response regulator n=1 Tax=Tepiditoga spiralis TaxID=2108365 RepID=A0A7G1G9E2_9BACT|nr:response regulator transcription factor [Tepiditoga spiralis]BBE31567.1 DNA-binding response regulator [Tepiditoga spiralis]
MIKVMIVDDQTLVREGISMLLSLCHDIELVAEASNGEEALNLIEEKKPDVILMDIKMPIMNGVKATKIIKVKYPNIKILILTTFKDDEFIFEALKNGADGYILKDVKSDKIIESIKTVYSGNLLLHSEIANKVIKELGNKSKNTKENKLEINGPYESLTSREVEIAQLISIGKSNKEISQLLFITEGTVKNHITRILSKLQIRDRTQLALYVQKVMNG